MEVIKNRQGLERVIEKLSHNKIRVMGENLLSRTSTDNKGNLTMFDFEGGPALNIGGKIHYMKSAWVIEGIEQENSNIENVSSVLLTVRLSY
jgi:hypothetical protein